MKPENIDTAEKVPAPLPVLQILLAGIVLPAKHASTLLRSAAPLIALMVLATVIGNWNQPDEPFDASAGWIVLSIFWALALIAAAALAVVGCHRVFILGRESMSDIGFLSWSSREMRFIGWWIGVGICVGIIITPFMLLVFPIASSIFIDTDQDSIDLHVRGLMFLINLPIAYFIGRWSLVFPATAVDERPSLKWAWDISKSNSWRLMVLIGLLPVGVNFILGSLPESESTFNTLFFMPAWLYVAAAEIAVLSLSYKALVESLSTDV